MVGPPTRPSRLDHLTVGLIKSPEALPQGRRLPFPCPSSASGGGLGGANIRQRPAKRLTRGPAGNRVEETEAEGGDPMRFRWPEDTVFRRVILDVEQECCGGCGRRLYICHHRRRRFLTLEGPVELCCRLAHCSHPACPSRLRTLSPVAEFSLSLPRWLIGWDVFCWMGHRRFARHWSVPQIRQELLDRFRIRLSEDAIASYLCRYQTML